MCTRTLFKADDGRVVTGRNMDWSEDMGTNLWAFGAGMKRLGENKNNGTPLEWESKYSTVVTCDYDGCTSDGMNSAGLVGNLQYLTESDFGDPGGKKQILSVAAWVQYLLDCCGSVAEAVEVMDRGDDLPFVITAPDAPNDKASTVHVSVSDPTGDSAIFEFVEGKPNVYHSPEYRVMTNSPTYDKQLAINTYWQDINAGVAESGCPTVLPGGSRGADRFARASNYLGRVYTKVDARQAAAVVLGVQRNASTPAFEPVEGQPEQSHTLWTTVIDSTDRRYYFQDCLSPYIIWFDLNRFSFGDSKSWKLDLQQYKRDGIDLQGDVSAPPKDDEPAKFKPENPFTFFYLGDPRLEKSAGTG